MNVISKSFYGKKDNANKRYKQLITSIDFSKDFFFSYFYDLTHSLQHNMSLSPLWTPPKPEKPGDRDKDKDRRGTGTGAAGADADKAREREREKEKANSSNKNRFSQSYNELFLWSLHMAREFLAQLPHASYWLVPLIQGFFAQKGRCGWVVRSVWLLRPCLSPCSHNDAHFLVRGSLQPSASGGTT